MQKFSEDFDENTGTRLGNALLPSARLARLGPRFAVILPGCARNFPVAALPVGTGRLIDQAVISVAPDVSTVVRVGDPASPQGDVFADPKGDLPSARREAEWTGGMTGASVRVGQMASETTLESLGFRQLLHFATHTEVDVAGPALVLADKNLTVADILQHRIRADLVVLASCHSGSNLRTTAAETLATAFLRAGSGAVLATLRSVEDRLAFDVIRAFYEAGGLADAAGALARVQRQLAHSEPPSQWAAFFVAGSAEALTAPRAVRLAQHSGG
jgi:CHAT domain-containing protein